MQVQGDIQLNKLILLFVFDKMEMPLQEDIILDICCSSNNWIAYMDCKEVLMKLIENEFVCIMNDNGYPLYSITAYGRECLSLYFIKIPSSLRANISDYIKNNRIRFRKKQECKADYYMNKDGSYTVALKIVEPAQVLVDLKFVVSRKKTAKEIYKKWEERAGHVYASLNEILVD